MLDCALPDGSFMVAAGKIVSMANSEPFETCDELQRDGNDSAGSVHCWVVFEVRRQDEVRGKTHRSRNAVNQRVVAVSLVYHSIWLNPQLCPAYVAVLSASLLVTWGICASGHIAQFKARITTSAPPTRRSEDAFLAYDAAETSWWRRHISRAGGSVILTFKFLRFIATASSLGLSTYTAVHDGWPKFGIVMLGTLVRVVEEAPEHITD